MAQPEFFHPEEHEEHSSQNNFEPNSVPKESLRPILQNDSESQISFDELKKAADLGNADAQFLVGKVYLEEGMFTEPIVSALDYLELAANQGHLQAQIKLGDLFDKYNCYKCAFEYYSKAANQGDPNAQNIVAYYFSNGLGVKKDSLKTFHYYQLAAGQGSKPALCNLAICYEEGQGVEKSLEKAFDLFKKAADQGYVWGQLHIARCYLNRIGVKRSLQKAVEYYKLALEQDFEREFANKQILFCTSTLEALEEVEIAADKGDADAQYQLGDSYLHGGFCLEKDVLTAIHYYKLAAEQGHLEACDKLYQLYDTGEYGVEVCEAKALKYLRILAEKGDPKWLNSLGFYYHHGKGGLTKSYEEAFKYFKLAADSGYKVSQFNLGIYYRDGLYVEQSNKRAFKYFRLSADQNYSKAQYELGQCFQKGRGVKRSYKQAIKYYKRAAEQGNANAALILANYFRYGIDQIKSYEDNLAYIRCLANNGTAIFAFNLGIDFRQGANGLNQSYEEAFKCFKIASDKGHATAAYNLGVYFEKGIGISPSREEAFKHYKLAADRGFARAQCATGNAYRLGQGVEKSVEKAYEYFKMAANQDEAEGLFYLGCYYEYGIGDIKQSYKEAFKYFKLAADQKYALAQYKLGVLYGNGKGVKRSFELASEYFKLAADQGEKRACYEVGKCFHFGFGVEESWDEAIKFYLMAAEKGHEKAREVLSILTKRIELRRAADQGDIEAQLELAKYYAKGNRVKRSIANACKYYRLAADQGNQAAQFQVGEYYRLGDFDLKESWADALVYYKLAASQGHIQSIRLLYNRYHYGKNVDLSEEEAAKYLKLGVEQNDDECQFQMGKYLQEGLGGINCSFIQALKYYKLAAAQGHKTAEGTLRLIGEILHPHANLVDLSPYLLDLQLSTLKTIFDEYEKKPIFLYEYEFSWKEAQIICEAMINNPHFTVICSEAGIARLCLAFELRGYQPDQDLEERRLTHSSNQPNVYGCVFIASEIGEGLSKAREESFKYLSGLSDDPKAQYYVSPFLLQEKIESRKNEKENFNFLKKWADQGNAEAQFYISIFYLNGTYGEKSKRKAFKYAKLAADQGMAEAQYNLAMFYTYGVGTKESSERANYYAKMAADQDLAPAQHMIKKFDRAAEQGYTPSLIELGVYYSRDSGGRDQHQALYYFQKALEQENVDCFYEKWRLERHIEECKKRINVQNRSLKAKEIHESLPLKQILHPSSKQLEMNAYKDNERLEMLKQAIIEAGDQPLHIYGSELSCEETITIRNAMIENPYITLVCPEIDGFGLQEAFDRIGFWECLKKLELYKKGKVRWFGFLFIGSR